MNLIQKTQTIELINRIKEQIEVFVEYEQNPPLIEVDIAKENLRKLYEIVDKMASKTEINYVEESKVEAIDNEIEDLLNQASKEFNDEQEGQILAQEEVLNEQIEEEELTPELIDENSEIFASEVIVAKEENPINIVADENQEEEPAAETTEEEVDEHKKIVHILDVEPEDEMEEEVSADKSLMSERFKKNAIKSLKQGIGINDKFMIINDLFEGRAKDFNAAIKELDSQDSLQAAIFLLEDMKDENIWENKDRAYIQFRSYVERRYM